MAPMGAAKTGRSKVRPKMVSWVSGGQFAPMVSMLTQISCHFW